MRASIIWVFRCLVVQHRAAAQRAGISAARTGELDSSRLNRPKAGLFPRAEEQADRPAPFPSPDILQNGPRRQGFASPRKTSAPLTAYSRPEDEIFYSA